MKKTAHNFVFLLNCTWGLLQTLAGAIAFLVFIRKPHYRYKGGVVTAVSGSWGGISLGSFIFIDTDIPAHRASGSNFINHEYGHTLQSALLGPLYFLIVGLPSLIWAGCFGAWRLRRNKSYYWLYCEKWADKWGWVKRG